MQQLKMVKVGRVSEKETRYTSPRMIFDSFRNMARLDREHFVVLHVDGKNRIIAKETVSVGSLNQTIVHPREVFKAAVHNGSAAIICVHNHPTGDPTPSNEDIGITRRLCSAGEILGIKVLDHIIVGDIDYLSFVEKGLFNGNAYLSDLPENGKPFKIKTRKQPALQACKASKTNIPAASVNECLLFFNYLKIKNDYPDAILFFDIGDSYAVLHDDSHLVATLLKTTKNRLVISGGDEIKISSFSYQSVSAHIEKLVGFGHKIAICSKRPEAGIEVEIEKILVPGGTA